MEKSVFEIPIKINSYEDLFNELDNRDIDKRVVKEEVDNFIDMAILTTSDDVKHMELNLIIHLPVKAKDEIKEVLVREGLMNHYEAVFEYQKKLKKFGVKRITYYAICSLILLVGWYYMVTYKDKSFISSLLNAGGTVLLWEIMSLVFIERKKSKDRAALNRKLSNMKVIFKYID